MLCDRHLSCAGRSILINSVLFSVHAYWCALLGLSLKTLRACVGTFGGFSNMTMLKPPSQEKKEKKSSLGKHLLAKKSGGLGVKDCTNWNMAAMVKHPWSVASDKTGLWFRWIHGTYWKDAGI